MPDDRIDNSVVERYAGLEGRDLIKSILRDYPDYWWGWWVLAELCDSVGILARGRMVAAGTVEELRRREAGRLLLQLFAKRRHGAGDPEGEGAPGDDERQK